MSPENEFKVLVIDDSPVSRKLTELPLREKGYQVVFCNSGRRALEVFRQEQPDLVITDWMMADLPGDEICRRIREEFGSHYAYIIVLTGQKDKESLVQALGSGADDFLTKPFHRGELLARVGAGARIAKLHRRITLKNRQLEQLALTDSLTGLPNRRAIEDWAATQFSSAIRHGFPFWLALADLDHFKQVNDTFGHNGGDAVLRRFSRILKNTLRKGDLCGRVGGEEFMLVLTHTDRENALKTIDRVRAELAGAPVNVDGCTIRVTASFGLAGADGTAAPSFGRLRELVDAALYSAKRAGRNRIQLVPAAAF